MSAPGDNQRDLTGLLKFCLQATTAEDGTSQGGRTLDPERRAFLQQVLSQMASDPVHELKNAMTMVSETLNHVPADADQEYPIVQEIEKVVDDIILDIVSSVDFANDFYKLDGLNLIKKFLSSHVSLIRTKGCELVAETVQNNPTAQEIVVKAGLLKDLCTLLEHDSDDTTQVKALYAISCTIRENEVATLNFDAQADGLSVLLRTLQKDSKTQKLRLKACFLIASLCTSEEKVRESLFRMGVVEQLVALLHHDHCSTHEHIASALFAIVSNHSGARDECVRPELGLELLLRQRITELEARPECNEEVGFYRELLKLCYPDNDDAGTR